ncbi:phosphatase PAP2 family protein [Candidatus Saccharibacteria bacterium]|nr:phosphatase PAP2 family protein [Candidatus Saccharibacteria bacterium]
MNNNFLVPLIADGLIFVIVLIGIYTLIRYIPKKQRYATYCCVLMAGLTSLLIAKLAGAIYQPSEVRPFVELGVSPQAAYIDNPGFPSDHVLFAAAITFAVLFAAKQRKLGLLLAGLTVLMGIGRVLALVHTPTDILGGILFAAIGALWYFQLPRFKTAKAHK